MPICDTRYFGATEYSQDAIIRFAEGPLGFEHELDFVLINRVDQYPLVYMQSTHTSDLCFLAFPVLAVNAEYRLTLQSHDAAALGCGETPAIGTDVLCLVLLTVREHGPTANLLAPIVVNLRTRAALQCLNLEDGYSHQHALTAAEEGVAA